MPNIGQSLWIAAINVWLITMWPSWLEGIIFFSLGLLTPMVSYMNLQELFAHCHIIVTWTLSKIWHACHFTIATKDALNPFWNQMFHEGYVCHDMWTKNIIIDKKEVSKLDTEKEKVQAKLNEASWMIYQCRMWSTKKKGKQNEIFMMHSYIHNENDIALEGFRRCQTWFPFLKNHCRIQSKITTHANSFMKEDIMYCGTMFLFWAEFCHLVTKQRKCKS